MSVNFDYQSQSNVFKVRQKSNINSSDLRAELGIIGENPSILLCFDLACRYARCDAPVCIFGSTGTGKEVFARAVHYISKRQALPFIPVNCGALPDTLFESELFGVVKGAFTGANADRAGLVEVAKGGTLFLDEVDCLSPKAERVSPGRKPAASPRRCADRSRHQHQSRCLCCSRKLSRGFGVSSRCLQSQSAIPGRAA